MANRFVLNERSYHGKGAIQEIAGEVKSRGLQKALVCSDPDLLKFGVTQKVTDVLDAAGIAYEVYSEIKPNPTIENVKDGVEAAKAAQADCIIAIGGGSSMDTAKAIGIIITNPEFADVRSLEGVAPPRTPACPSSPCPPPPAPPRRSPSTTSSPTWRRTASSSVWTPDIPVVAVVDPDMMASMPQGPDCRHRHGRPDPRHRGLHHQGRLGAL